MILGECHIPLQNEEKKSKKYHFWNLWYYLGTTKNSKCRFVPDLGIVCVKLNIWSKSTTNDSKIIKLYISETFGF